MYSILFLGDIVGKGGRKAVASRLPGLISELEPDVVIANGENSAGGAGITPATAEEIFKAGVHVITSGDHVWDRSELEQYLINNPQRILRPANYPVDAPGSGCTIYISQKGVRLGVVNLIGRVFMRDPVYCPFRTIDELLAGPMSSQNADLVFIDFHAEATSEKNALGRYVDGRVAAVIGSHTHVPTADEQILPHGTAYLTDAGMCGPRESVIGVKQETAVKRFIAARPLKLEVMDKGPVRVNGAFIRIDEKNKRAEEIRRVSELVM